MNCFGFRMIPGVSESYKRLGATGSLLKHYSKIFFEDPSLIASAVK
jgi:hypothetical protein